MAKFVKALHCSELNYRFFLKVFCLFESMLYVPVNTFSWTESLLSREKSVLLKEWDINIVPHERLKQVTPRSQVKHSTTESICSSIGPVKPNFQHKIVIIF